MTKTERTQLKFAHSSLTGQLVSFVRRVPKTKKLIGVRENNPVGKLVVVLSDDLKEHIIPGQLYNVELKAMHSGNGFVAVTAEPKPFEVVVQTEGTKVFAVFGYKKVYFDPLYGNTPSSNTLEGALREINRRTENLTNRDQVIEEFEYQSRKLLSHIHNSGKHPSREHSYRNQKHNGVSI